MLIDLLNSSNYIMVNMDAIRIFGLLTAVYCSELLNIYKKAYKKKRFFIDGTYFEVDREYIKKQTSIEPEDQLKCDINLAKSGVDVIKISEDNPNIICLDVERFASLLSSQDIKLLENISKKANVSNPKGSTKAKKDYMIQQLKDSVECRNTQILEALFAWIDTIMTTKYLSKTQVKLFKDKIDDYCSDGDVNKALAIINLAITHAYVDCQWAINLYERNNKPIYTTSTATQPRITIQKKTTDFGDETF